MFKGQNHEYFITYPSPPVLWINCFGASAFGGSVNHAGGALIPKEDLALKGFVRTLENELTTFLTDP